MKFLDRRLFRRSLSSRRLIIISVFNVALITILTIVQARLLADLIEGAFLLEKSFNLLSSSIYSLIAIMIGRVILSFVGENYTNRISHKIRIELRAGLFQQVLKNGGTLNLKYGPGRISLIATKAISNLEPYFTRFIPQIFIAVLVPIVVGITIALLDFISGVIILLTLPLIPLFGVLIGKYTNQAMARRWRTMGILSGYLMDLLSGLTTLKLYGREKLQEEKIEQIGARYRSETMRVLRISFLTSLVLEVIAMLSVALIAVSIGLRLVEGNFELWRGLMILILAPEVYWPIRNLSAQFHASVDAMESSRDIFEILDHETLVSGVEAPPNSIKEISWSELTISYTNRDNLVIPAGRATAGEITILLGESGSGKTSLVNVIMKLVEPASGEILVDGKNLNLFSRPDWLSTIAWVPEEPQFPALSIRELFSLSSPNASEAKIKETLASVGLCHLNLDSSLALSVGQRRRIAIARALIGTTSMLIMDEPSASLDEETEAKIVEIIEMFAQQGKITIAVSHRQRLIEIADNIIEFSEQHK